MEGMNEYNLLKQQQAQADSAYSANLRQRMSDLGLGAPKSLTLSNNIEMGGRGNIGAITAQEQALTDYRAALGNQNAANLLTQNLQADANKYAFDTANELATANLEYDRWFELWKKRKITAKQFKQKTGYDVSEWPSRRRRPNDGPDDPNNWFDTIGTSSGASAGIKVGGPGSKVVGPYGG